MSTPLALYVHWPFCVAKCPYCDFNSHVRASVDQASWRDALLTDLAHEAARFGQRRTVDSIFFGGGTPSLMPPATVAAVIDAAGRHFDLAPDVEITLEANPSSVEAANFAGLAVAGVNRVSLGLQALDDAALTFLGRVHRLSESLAALDVAQRHFRRVSIDLIAARPGQGLKAWEAELARGLAFGTGHISIYQLTIEPGTRFATLAAKGQLALPDEELAADIYAATDAMTAAAGRPAYEISNHAAPGQESRHNLHYWRYDDHLAIGPGAHGRALGEARVRHRKPENWIAAVQRDGHSVKERVSLDPVTRANEALLMGLRLVEGVELARIAALSGVPRNALVDESAVERLARMGMVAQQGDRLRVRRAGRLLLDHILGEIVLGGEVSAPAPSTDAAVAVAGRDVAAARP